MINNRITPDEIFSGHMVNGESVVPGAYFVLKASANDTDNTQGTCLRDVRFPSLCLEHDLSSTVVDCALQDITVSLAHNNQACLHAQRDSFVPVGMQKQPWHDSKHALAEQQYQQLEAIGNKFTDGYRSVHLLTQQPDTCIVDSQTQLLTQTQLLDACIHSLLVRNSESLKTTMVLSHIDKVWLTNEPFTAPLKVEFANIQSTNTTLSADLSIYARTGELVSLMSGLSFVAVDSKAVQSMNIGGSFTLQPIAEAFNALSADSPLRVGVALYEYRHWQHFLLDPSIHSTSSLMNVLVVRPEDLIKRHLLSQEPDNLATHYLPNGLQVAQINEYETDYLYKEIFIDRCYARNGVIIEDNDVVIDVGANIGMFSLYAINQANNVTVHAFEPSPMAAQCLAANVAGRGNVNVYQSGVSGHHGHACFTFYPKTSVFSGFFTDGEADTEAVRHVIYNQVKRITKSDDESFLNDLTEQMLKDRLEKQDIDCDLIGLSAFIKEQNIDQIGLLKIDAEKAELGILQAMTKDDFSKVRQICLEVHDEQGDNLKAALNILEQNGFSVLVEVESELSNTGLYTVTAKREAHQATPSKRKPYEQYGIELDFADFEQVLNSYSSQSQVPLTLLLTPTQAKEPIGDAVNAWAQKLITPKRVNVVLPSDLKDIYPQIQEFSDNVVTEAMIPFSQSWYAAAASTSLKHLSLSQKQPHKVIVVDADNTLWNGVVGELGIEGITVNAQHKALQSRLLKQKQQGVLLALCSKNIEKDVVDALQQHPDMLLSPDDFIIKKVNWQAKSQNITDIEQALSLSANSFIFIDDNEAECAEVAAHHPQTLCLQFPASENEALQLINQHWLFNDSDGSEFDATRHQLYIDQGQRDAALKNSKTYADFIRELAVTVEICTVTDQQIERVSQLTSRTNQFNANKQSYSVNELIHKQRQGDVVLTLSASDKFGDYGLVGVALYRFVGDSCEVENILLSCRALNKGIEHQFLRAIAHSAAEHGCNNVCLQWCTTERNLPLRQFYDDVAQICGQTNTQSPLEVASEKLLNLSFNPQHRAETSLSDTTQQKPTSKPQGLPLQALNVLFERTSDLTQLVEQAWPALDGSKVKIKGASELQQTLGEIWATALGVSPSSIDDEFTSLGGRSLLLVRVLELIYQKFGVKLSLFDGIKFNTLRTLADKLEHELQSHEQLNSCAKSEFNEVAVPDIAPTLQGLYFSALLNPATSAYNVPVHLQLQGNVCIETIERAVRQVIDSAPNLSTGYKQAGRETKAVNVEQSVLVQHHDARTWTERDISGYVQKAAVAAINIKQGPLVHLHTLSTQRCTDILLVMHHLSVDLQSMELLIERLKQVLSGQAITHESGVQSAFSQRLTRLEPSFINEAMQHWQTRLSDAPLLSLPVHDNSERQSLDGAGFVVSLSRESSAILNEKIRSSDQSAYVFLLAAYFRFLNQYCGDEKMVVGTPVSLRQGNEHHSIGNFVNQVPVTLHIDNTTSWAQVLEDTSKEVYASLQYREIPFSTLVRQFCKQPTSGRAALAQTTFALHQSHMSQAHIEYAFAQGMHSPEFNLGPYKATLQGLIQQCGQVDIAIECLDIEGQLHVNVKYDTQLIKQQDALHFADEFIKSLESL
ncbi:hypothetical protein PA25_30460 [Pseudoalteromonas sp. A25]|uniref:FkbM family methyltransferase n=1 Tax=Pseudoalteromonas sp. A25 TaxID=116092 RepID=UPI001260CAE6|nr:FkbM family methyltransferase [Pseudoalteromonas sp. A25]BBN83061.1 hypothetical protein PA25_30460 [Pseudoalteromonas sp. A25]